MVKVDRAERLAEAAAEIGRLLRQRHGLDPSAPDDFTVRNLAEVQASRQAASGVLTFWLTAVASVSLLVGGISIMNVMLVSVSERTREIGLRMAVGARGGEILQQFMVEALLLSSIGGAAGLALGILASLTAAAWADIPILVSPIALFLALGAAVATGVASGVFPALKASRLSPVVALADARETQFHAPATPPETKPG
jgi:putative ABC transport system permease protein